MKTPSRNNTAVIKRNAVPPSPTKVCMYVRGPARPDVRVMREATALAEAGYAVSIVDVEDESHRPIQEEFQNICLKHIFKSKKVSKTRFIRIVFFRGDLLRIKGILRLLRTPANIYHAHDTSGLLPCYIAALVRRKPLIFDAHELPLYDISSYPYIFRLLLFFFLKFMLLRCAGVITVSPYIGEYIRVRYRIPEISLVRNVPPYRLVTKSNRLRQLLGLGNEVLIVLYQGNIQTDRNLEMWIYAARFLKPGIVIVMMGKANNNVLKQFEAVIEREGVGNQVKILPPVPYEDLLDWTSSADIGLVPHSPDHSLNVQWCLPNKLFEYIMAGLPVLATPLDAVKDVVNQYDIGQIVPSFAPAAIAATIEAMLADHATLGRMRRNAFKAVQQNLCWEQEKLRLLQLYQNIPKAPTPF
ncbi:glycosyl transferase [Dictyobacter vulcani]|uniref:Glycosyl transferase n=1 Tax=Dictyobacter vulcani TaxID=2607529 RepID=A0A5J4KC54_9CHLR|nr:glycosyltransferase family 4 protein [Dictyobacter vulcani]GER86354.1 glycosyl transferase [Dictyobacter vulcani]